MPPIYNYKWYSRAMRYRPPDPLYLFWPISKAAAFWIHILCAPHLVRDIQKVDNIIRLDFFHSLVSGVPSLRRTARRMSGKACLSHKVIIKIKILSTLLMVRKCHLMTIIGRLTWHLRLVTFVHVPFSPPPLLTLVLQPILFHAIVMEEHYMLFSMDEFFFLKGGAELFDCGVKWHVKGHCIMLTPCFCFASSVGFGLFKNLILSGFVKNWCHFPSRRLPYTSIWVRIFPWDRCLHLSLSLLTLVIIWHYGTTIQVHVYRISCIKSVQYFVCSICRYGMDQALFHQCKKVPG